MESHSSREERYGQGMMDKLKEPQFILTVVVVFLAAVYDFGVSFFPMHLDSHLEDVILTTLNLNGFVVVVQYWLGSSAGSKEKTEQMTRLAAPNGNGQPH